MRRSIFETKVEICSDEEFFDTDGAINLSSSTMGCTMDRKAPSLSAVESCFLLSSEDMTTAIPSKMNSSASTDRAADPGDSRSCWIWLYSSVTGRPGKFLQCRKIFISVREAVRDFFAQGK